MSVSIAIDGPAGAGKSTIAKLVAEKLHMIYVDTGAMYRAMGLHFHRKGISPEDEAAICAACKEADISITYEDGAQQVLLNGENVTGYLRTEEAGKMASATSGYAKVREKLVELQQKLAAEKSVVMDGRDIGTVVLPRADVKIYLTASVEARARRRFLELEEKGVPCRLEEIAADIEKRDYQDMHRENSPLKQAEDAVYLDSSEMTVKEVTDAIIDVLFRKKMAERGRTGSLDDALEELIKKECGQG
ncbi:MAG: (d)CMP kinase [Lachnospiraceae bacterium]|jgi:cytidylate kinase|nr:(d)CMP kinase [Lachnospiraceae bacterium]